MNNSKKCKLNFITFVIFLILIFPISVSANTIYSIDMSIYLDENGNASVTEVWHAYLSSGTEGYRAFSNLGYSEISNFSVVDESEIIYTDVGYWTTTSTFDDKAYTSGIYYTNSGLELCWGISSYGNKYYTLTYEISNVVVQYVDYQAIYFNFINISQDVNSATINIYSDYEFNESTASIWGFGYTGEIIFSSNSVSLTTEDNLSSSDYMVALIKFEDNLFNTSASSTQTFDEIYQSATKEISIDWTEIVYSYIMYIFNIISSIILIMFFVVVFIKIIQRVNTVSDGSLNFGEFDKNRLLKEQIPYFRDIPCNKDIEIAYWVASKYNIILPHVLKKGIMGAYLLKFVLENKIRIIKNDESITSFKEDNYSLYINNIDNSSNYMETTLLMILKKASGTNGILEPKEFQKWSMRNAAELNIWFKNLLDSAQSNLEKQTFITQQVKNISKSSKKTKNIVIKNVGPEMYNEAIKLSGLKKYFNDFTIISEREFQEVKVWNDYLIFAHILDEADKVELQFNKLYPQNIGNLNFHETHSYVNVMTNSGIKGFSAGYSSGSGSSGGGGSSSSGGGSSSGGSSGGGFR